MTTKKLPRLANPPTQVKVNQPVKLRQKGHPVILSALISALDMKDGYTEYTVRMGDSTLTLNSQADGTLWDPQTSIAWEVVA